MGRQTDDGRHEGHVAHIFADGMSGGGWGGGRPTATTAADGTRLDDRQYRRGADVVAWQVICTDNSTYRYPECWRGPVWTRVATEAEHDPAQHRIYCGDDRAMLPEDVEDLLMEDWDRHIAPFQGCYAIEVAAEAVAEAQKELTDAVRSAREHGASWEAIGRAAGMTRQSAHERWAKAVGTRG